MSAVTGPGAPAWLREVPAVEILRRVWVQNFCRLDDDASPSEPDKPQVLRWRTEVEGYPPSALMVASPHDLDVHYAKKRQTTWIGYKVHLTETCGSGQLNLITHVETTTAPVVDRDVLADVHAALKSKDLRPERHLVDAGYIDADGLVASARDHGITLVGPPPADNQWQARTEGAFAIEHLMVSLSNHRSRLGPPDRHLSGGPNERKLDPRHQWRPRQRPHPIFPDPLQGLPAQGPVHALEPARPLSTTPAGARNPRRGPDRGQGPGVHRGTKTPRRHRGHLVEGGACQRPAPQPLRRCRQDPPPAGSHGGGDQPRPHRRLDRREQARTDPKIRLHPPQGSANLSQRIRQQYRFDGSCSLCVDHAARIKRRWSRSRPARP